MTLTPAQVLAWNAFAKNNPVSDVFGRSQTLSGIQTFVRLNGVILNCGGTQIDNPPTSLTISGIVTLTAAAAAGTPTFTIAYTPTPLDTNVKLSVYATQQLPTGRTFAKPYLRWIFASAGAAASPANVLSAYTAKFGALVAGSRIAVNVNAVDVTTGAQTTGLYSMITVAA
jgi:hypothetical protein